MRRPQYPDGGGYPGGPLGMGMGKGPLPGPLRRVPPGLVPPSGWEEQQARKAAFGGMPQEDMLQRRPPSMPSPMMLDSGLTWRLPPPSQPLPFGDAMLSGDWGGAWPPPRAHQQEEERLWPMMMHYEQQQQQQQDEQQQREDEQIMMQQDQWQWCKGGGKLSLMPSPPQERLRTLPGWQPGWQPEMQMTMPSGLEEQPKTMMAEPLPLLQPKQYAVGSFEEQLQQLKEHQQQQLVQQQQLTQMQQQELQQLQQQNAFSANAFSASSPPSSLLPQQVASGQGGQSPPLLQQQQLSLPLQAAPQSPLSLLQAKRPAEDDAGGADSPKRARQVRQMCRLFMMGGCTKGDGCLDAHGEEQMLELDQIPAENSSSSADGAQAPVELQPEHSVGSAAATPQLVPPPDRTAEQTSGEIDTILRQMGATGLELAMVSPAPDVTEASCLAAAASLQDSVCRRFQKAECSYGEQCAFAHVLEQQGKPEFVVPKLDEAAQAAAMALQAQAQAQDAAVAAAAAAAAEGGPEAMAAFNSAKALRDLQQSLVLQAASEADPGAAAFHANTAAAWAAALQSAGLLESTAAAVHSAFSLAGSGQAALAAAAAAAAESLLLAQAQSDHAAGAAQLMAQAAATEAAQSAQRPAYKTQACRFWPSGRCFKGVLCTYAHGDEDLRPYLRGGVPSTAPPY